MVGGYQNIPANRIIAWLERYFQFKTRKGGAEFLINNPFDSDTGYNFNINPENGFCHDWRGDSWAGPINPETGKRNCSFIKFVRLFKKCTYKEALQDVLGASEDVSDYLNPKRRVTDPKAQRKISVALPEGTELLATSKDRQAKILIHWLKSRGYTEDDIAKHELYHLGMDVYWPYYEWDTLVYYQSRSRLNKRFNFPATEIFDDKGNIIGVTDGGKSDFLYGHDDVEMATNVIITEAIFDQYTIGTQALASGGAVLSTEQIKKLRVLGPKDGVILAPDNDTAGINSIFSNCQLLLRQGFKVHYSLPPKLAYERDGKKFQSKDFNEIIQYCGVTRQELRKMFDNSIRDLTKREILRLKMAIRDTDSWRNIK